MPRFSPTLETLNLAIRYLWRQFDLRGIKNSPPLELPQLLQIHSLLVVSGYHHHRFSFLTRLLLHCLSLPSFPRAYALSVFNQIPQPGVFAYNAAIRGFSSDAQIAVVLYSRMRREGVFPDKHTFPLILRSKIGIQFQIFAQVMKFGFESDRFVRNALISAMANCGSVDCARQVFDEITDADAVAYTALMDGYVKNNRALHTLDLFLEMTASPAVGVDEIAVVTALCAAGSAGCIWLGRWIHGFYIVCGRVVQDVYIGCALIDMYSKGGFCDDALKVFWQTPCQNLVTWNALLAGCVKCDWLGDALHLFRKMLAGKTKPSEATLVTVLTGCARLGALHQGRWIHGYIGVYQLELSSMLGTALIDMYAKCGCTREANLVFDRMTVKDVYPWTALIFGLAINGDAKGALNVFYEMVSVGIQPNEVTFIAVICGCSHGGLVDEGREVFVSMDSVYGVRPTVDHYGCMVDLLGRARQLEEAVRLINGMPFEPSVGVWGALFNACMIHKVFELGRDVGHRLIQLQPDRGSRYALLANMYSEWCDWKGAAKVRKEMNGTGVAKSRGCSWVEVDGVVHEFVAFDQSHTARGSIYGIVECLTAEMGQSPVGSMPELSV